MDIGSAVVDLVVIPEGRRPVDQAKVDELAESMAAIGLQQPISVWFPDNDTLELVAGRHRLEAARKLGWRTIPCVFVHMDKLDRQLWEIDENLCRADLTNLQRAQHTARRAEVVKQKILIPQSEEKPAHRPNTGQGDFVKETAKKTGRSKASVERDKARGEKIAPDVQKDIAGTDIEDSGVQLDALAAVDHDEQRKAVSAVVLGHAKDVRDVLPGSLHRTSPCLDGLAANSGSRVSALENQTAEELCRRGMEIEASGMSAKDTAAKLGIGLSTYDKIKNIVRLSKCNFLTEMDRFTIDKALETVNEQKQVGPVYEFVEPIANHMWGEKRGMLGHDADVARRLREFDRVAQLIWNTCTSAPEVVIPYLNEDREKEIQANFDEAIQGIRELKLQLHQAHHGSQN